MQKKHTLQGKHTICLLFFFPTSLTKSISISLMSDQVVVFRFGSFMTNLAKLFLHPQNILHTNQVGRLGPLEE